MSTASSRPWHTLRTSKIHGTGVYAARRIPAGTRIFEYVGEIISADEADRRHPVNPDDPFHTFFFALSNGTVIDGNVGGNDAKWINHSCEPNCETEESDDFRVFILALRDIGRGEELYYDYGLVLDERLTKTVREQYRCLCGTPSCRGTMLALKRRRPAVKKAASPKPADKAASARRAEKAGLTKGTEKVASANRAEKAAAKKKVPVSAKKKAVGDTKASPAGKNSGKTARSR
jgi:hypothetical protein